MKVECNSCGKIFNKYPSMMGIRFNFCNNNCYKEFLIKNPTENPNYKKENSYKCGYCNKNIRVNKSRQRRNKNHFCSRKCANNWMSENMVGERACNFKHGLFRKECFFCGKEYTTTQPTASYCSVKCKTQSQITKKTIICHNCKRKFQRHISLIYWNNKRGYKYIFCSIKCSGEYNSGKNNCNYIQDRTKLKNQDHSTRWSTDMRDWRKAVYQRDGYVCQMCGNKSKKNNAVTLNAHHIEKFSGNKNKRFNIENGITLCESCHKLTYGKEEMYENEFKKRVTFNKSATQIQAN